MSDSEAQTVDEKKVSAAAAASPSLQLNSSVAAESESARVRRKEEELMLREQQLNERSARLADAVCMSSSFITVLLFFVLSWN